MTESKIDKIDKVFCKYMDDIMRDLTECDITRVVFDIGRHMGMMHEALIKELREEDDLE